MRKPLLRALWTFVSVGFYLSVCRGWAAWVGVHAIALSAALWLPLLVGVARIWNLGWKRTAAVGVGAALACAMWSPSFVDFPSPWAERSPWGGLLFLGPVIIAFFVGLMLTDGGPLAAGLVVALADPALLPVRIWNSDTHVAGGWSMYPYPAFQMEIPGLLVFTAFGIGAGYLGERLRRLFAARSKPPDRECRRV